MKENYFTAANIDKKSNHFLRKLHSLRQRHQIEFRSEHSALLVIDMQKYFLDPSSDACLPAAWPIIPKIKKLLNAFKKRGRPVIFTRHINDSRNAGMLEEWWGEFIAADDPLSEIFPELKMPDSLVIEKTQYDAFYKTSLEDVLNKKKVKQIVVTGVMTHLCCETTARSAFMRGLTVFFPVDGTATQNEDFHRGTLLNLAHGFAVLVLVEELLKSFEG